MGQNGVHWGVYRVNFGVFEGPRPFGSRNNAKRKLSEKVADFGPKGLGNLSGLGPKNRPKYAQMGPVGFWGLFLALPGPFMTALGLSLGPSLYIFIILGVPKPLRTQ